MAKFEEIIVIKGLTVSVGRYESIRVDASLKIVLDETDDTDTIFEAGFEMCDEQLNKQVEEIQDIIGKDSVFKVDKNPDTNKTKPSRRRRK